MDIIFIGKIVGALTLGTISLYRKIGFKGALQISLYAYSMSWLFVAMLYGCSFIVRIILKLFAFKVDLAKYVLEYKWYISGTLFIILIFILLIDSEREEIIKTKRVSINNKKPVVMQATAKPKHVMPINPITPSKNLTNINNKISNGQSVTIDFRNYMQSEIYNSVMIASKSGAKITLTNLKGVHADTLSLITKLARGKVILDYIYDNVFDAEILAESGACFTFDCKKKPSRINDIAIKSKKGHGYVGFINISWMNPIDMQKLRNCGGDNIEIR